MKVLVCENRSSATSSLFLVTDCLGKKFTGINIADIEKQSPPIRQQVDWRNYSEQWTEKQNSVKTCTKSPKKETTPIYKKLCSFN